MTEASFTHAGGIVTKINGKDRKYLIVRSSTDPNHWVLPKGHIKPGESPEIAALREVREETGVMAEIIGELGSSKFIRDTEKIHVLYFVMRYKTSRQAVEDREIKWCDDKEALALLSFEDAKELLKKTISLE